ncbi:lysophospholipid acyltransferase family protein [Cryptosporangium aurantiacum]|uniref:1-acyl-sn-glycerol-3-phosphate acyltransferase n=1 Tax=Cryptosporangium aurantiacum TaxID=134849 RepID=A0A1M7R7D9_9ACTN|nr:lysophospholipid acyltransferase family protein [Cryptosporangium aurantiacum]SHN42227.1 1-acyl-sn-glycerol-3-phosphate acyltransferase [Cryptosporangium aurantiacum]
MFYWVCKYILIGPILRVLFRPVLEGVEHIPAHGPAILASNHLSFCDSFFFPLMVPRRITFLAKAEYFTGKGPKGLFSRLFFSAAGCVPIDRASGSAAEAALTTGARILGEGHLLGIYPEGTRSPDGKLYRGKTGVARLALQTGVPVIPVAMINTDQVQPIGQLIPRIMRVRMRVGTPLDFSRYAGMDGNRFVERSVTDQIMYELLQLSGQEYRDVYAASVKSNTSDAEPGRTAAERIAA